MMGAMDGGEPRVSNQTKRKQAAQRRQAASRPTTMPWAQAAMQAEATAQAAAQRQTRAAAFAPPANGGGGFVRPQPVSPQQGAVHQQGWAVESAGSPTSPTAGGRASPEPRAGSPRAFQEFPLLSPIGTSPGKANPWGPLPSADSARDDGTALGELEYTWLETAFGLSIGCEDAHVAHLNEGMEAAHNKDYRRAMECYALARTSPHSVVRGTAWFREAKARQAVQHISEAQRCCAEARRDASDCGSPMLLAQVLRAEAALLKAATPPDLPGAMAKTEESLMLSKWLRSDFAEGAALSEIGHMCLQMNDLARAERTFRQLDALHCRTQEGEPQRIYPLSALAGVLAQQKGRAEEAVEVLETALPIAEQNGPVSMVARLSSTLHNLLAARGQSGTRGPACVYRRLFASALRSGGREPTCFGDCPLCGVSMDDEGALPVVIRPKCYCTYHIKCHQGSGRSCPVCNPES